MKANQKPNIKIEFMDAESFIHIPCECFFYVLSLFHLFFGPLKFLIDFGVKV